MQIIDFSHLFTYILYCANRCYNNLNEIKQHKVNGLLSHTCMQKYLTNEKKNYSLKSLISLTTSQYLKRFVFHCIDTLNSLFFCIEYLHILNWVKPAMTGNWKQHHDNKISDTCSNITDYLMIPQPLTVQTFTGRLLPILKSEINPPSKDANMGNPKCRQKKFHVYP